MTNVAKPDLHTVPAVTNVAKAATRRRRAPRTQATVPVATIVKAATRRRRAPRTQTRPDARTLGVVAQVRMAFQRQQLLATLLGGLLGGFVPAATFTVAHQEVLATVPLRHQPLALLVLGGLVYSAKTVYAWGRMAFASGAKALGFTLLIEGVMTCSSVEWLSYAALAYLIAINAIATGCILALAGSDHDGSRMAADDRPARIVIGAPPTGPDPGLRDSSTSGLGACGRDPVARERRSDAADPGLTGGLRW